MSEQPRRVAVDGAQRIGSGAPYETIQLRLVVEAEARKRFHALHIQLQIGFLPQETRHHDSHRQHVGDVGRRARGVDRSLAPRPPVA